MREKLIIARDGNLWFDVSWTIPDLSNKYNLKYLRDTIRDISSDKVATEINRASTCVLTREKLLQGGGVGVRTERVRIFGISNLNQDAQDFVPSWKFRKKLHQQSQLSEAFVFDCNRSHTSKLLIFQDRSTCHFEDTGNSFFVNKLELFWRLWEIILFIMYFMWLLLWILLVIVVFVIGGCGMWLACLMIGASDMVF